jgi:DNA-binding LacI/PurR family transcriptional regulator
MADVAREAGVSRALVSIAFRGVPGVSDETKSVIFEAADRLNYTPNKIAAQLASRGSQTYGVYLLNLRNELFADIYSGVCEVIGPQGNHLVLSIGFDEGGREREAIEALIEARVGVVIAAGLLSSDLQLARLAQQVPIVSAGRRVPGIDSVYSDDVLGARMAVEHLLQLGHRRIMHLASPPRDGYIHRRAGYLKVMSEWGLAPQIVETSYSREAAADAVAPALLGDNLPTAIFANNDQTALGVLDALYERGLRCPEDVSLVGYDNTPVGSLPAISLTSVDIHGVELGRRVANAAKRRLKEPAREAADEKVPPTLIVRGSTAAPR